MSSPRHSFTDIIAASRRSRIAERALPNPGRRSWFYRVFIAPFADMDHRAVWINEQLRGRW